MNIIFVIRKLNSCLYGKTGEKVTTTNFTTSKTKKNIEKFGDDHNIEKLYERDQNVKKGKDQNIKSVF